VEPPPEEWGAGRQSHPRPTLRCPHPRGHRLPAAGDAERPLPLHGGHSTGPRTPDGIASIRAARTTHGYWTQESRANRDTIAALHAQARLWIAIASSRRHRPDIAIRQIERALASFPYRRGGSSFLSRVGSTFS
jgi:hypothetical protein